MTQKINLIKGDTDKIKVVVYSEDGIKDLTGYSGKMLIKHTEKSDELIADIEHSNDESDLPNGALIFVITKEISAAMVAGEHRYMVKIENEDELKTVKDDKIVVSESL